MRFDTNDIGELFVIITERKVRLRAFKPNPEYDAESVEPDTEWVNEHGQVFRVDALDGVTQSKVGYPSAEMYYYESGNSRTVQQSNLDEWYAFGQIRSVVEIEVAPDVDSDLSSDSGSGS